MVYSLIKANWSLSIPKTPFFYGNPDPFQATLFCSGMGTLTPLNEPLEQPLKEPLKEALV